MTATDLDDALDSGPRRVWILPKGSYLWPGWPDEPRPWVFLGGDEYGNRTLCLRLPFRAVLVVALTVPLRRTLIDPTMEEALDGWV